VPGVLPGQRLTWGALQYCEVHSMRGRQDDAVGYTQDNMRRCAAVVSMLVVTFAAPGSVSCPVESVDTAASMSGNGSRCADSSIAAAQRPGGRISEPVMQCGSIWQECI
jgi:hypothetical protein